MKLRISRKCSLTECLISRELILGFYWELFYVLNLTFSLKINSAAIYSYFSTIFY